MSAGVVPRPGRAATAPTALPLLAENQPECPSQPSTPLVAEHEQQLPALDRSLPTAQQLEQPAPSSPGAGTAHGWFSMWSHDLELDQLFYPLAAGMWLPYITRLWPVTTPAEHVQHVGQATAILLLAALAWRSPAHWYRRWSPLPRLILLFHCFCLPFFSSLTIFNHTAPAPSQVPGLRLALDFYQLWMAGRGALVGFALVGTHPPLHVALPLALFGLWRAQVAGFCRSDILRHPVMRQRTAMVHSALSMASQAVGFPTISIVSGQDTDQQCRSLLLFVNVLVNGFLPVLLLVPLSHDGRASSEPSLPSARHLRWLHAVDRRLECGLRWLACGATRRQRAEERTFGVPLCALRRVVMLATLWLVCCILES